jgi:chemotaxis protein MotB
MSEEVEDEGGGEGGGSPAWMATFGDLMSLLLCFFVLLLSFATMDIIKFTQMVGSLQSAFGVQQEMIADFQTLSTSPIEFSKTQSSLTLDILETPTSGQSQADESRKLVTEIERVVRELDLAGAVEVENEERGVVLRVSGGLLFGSGGTEIHPDSEPLLSRIAEIASRISNQISIEGHSDDQQIRTERYPSNWHLAAGRAIATLEHLAERDGLERERMNAASYGPTRPLVPNDSEEARAANRRVEFVFLREGRASSRFAPGSPARVLDEAGAFD